ncbi:MAG: Rieske 2Fe-2S domain-containing protein [Myxococcota bacterium]
MALTRLCTLFQLPIRGGRLFENVDRNGLDLLVFRLEGGRIVAYEASCPHAGALLKPEHEMGGVLTCFLHLWQFDVATGDCITIPQCRLTAFEIVVQGVDVLVELPKPTGEEPPP